MVTGWMELTWAFAHNSMDEGGGAGGSRGSGCLGGGPGGSRGSRGGPEVLGGKRIKHEKTRKTLRNCMASLLRSNIQDFVQEVPVGQMAQGTPFRCLPPRNVAQYLCKYHTCS